MREVDSARNRSLGYCEKRRPGARSRRSVRRITSVRRPTMRGRESSEGWKSAKPRGSERWKKRTRGSSVGGRPGRADSHSQRGQRKKVVSPSARRRAVKMSVQEGIGKVAAACRALGLSRSSYYRSGRSSLESRRIRKEVLELSASILAMAIGALPR